MVVLDTNVLSELMKPTPDPKVVAWVGDQPGESLYTTTISEGEILRGIQALPEGRRRAALAAAAEGVFGTDLAGRVLAFDRAAARRYATITGERGRAGLPISHADAQIAAIARDQEASLATRNLRDFEGCGLTLINPWQ